MPRPTISVMMPNYNHARFIPVAMRALLGQSVPPTEVIFIDDASTDDSLGVAERYLSEFPALTIIKNPTNRGVNYNMNLALEMATGDYLVGAACDDMILPGFFEKSLDLLAAHPGAGLCSCLSRIIDEDGRDEGVLPMLKVTDRPAYLPPERVRRVLGTFGNWMQGNATIYRREALIEAGGFRPELHSFSDNFAAQVIALRHGACFIPEPLCAWRRMNTTYSARCRTDRSVHREIVRNATALMEREYRGDFPRGHSRVWKRELDFEDERTRLRSWVAAAGTDGPGSRGGPVRLRARLATGVRRLAYLAATAFSLVRHRPRLAVRRALVRLLSGGMLPPPRPDPGRGGSRPQGPTAQAPSPSDATGTSDSFRFR